MIEPPTRRGGWPGPRKPQWAFRPTPEVEAAVAAYMAEHDVDRSGALNAMLAGESEHVDGGFPTG